MPRYATRMAEARAQGLLWTPANLHGVKVWHKHYPGVQYSAGALTGMTDLSGNGFRINNISGTITAGQSAKYMPPAPRCTVPAYANVTGGVGSHSASSAFTIAVIMYASSATANGGGKVWSLGSTTLDFRGTTSGPLGLTNGTATVAVNPGFNLTASETNRINVFLIRYNNTVEKRQINGINQNFAANAGFTSGALAEYCYFNRVAGGNASSWGGMELHEAVYIPRELTDLEADQLTGYLWWEHRGPLSVPLALSHRYKDRPPFRTD